MRFLSNFGSKITFMCSVNFWHQQEYNSLFKGSIGHVTSKCKRPIVNYPSNYCCFTKQQARVVQRLDNTIHRINQYPVDSVVCFVNIYPLDSELSGRQRYPAFEELGPEILFTLYTNKNFKAQKSLLLVFIFMKRVQRNFIAPVYNYYGWLIL